MVGLNTVFVERDRFPPYCSIVKIKLPFKISYKNDFSFLFKISYADKVDLSELEVKRRN